MPSGYDTASEILVRLGTATLIFSSTLIFARIYFKSELPLKYAKL